MKVSFVRTKSEFFKTYKSNLRNNQCSFRLTIKLFHAEKVKNKMMVVKRIKESESDESM